jgi:trimeric autotransporter adhesin
VLRPGRADAGAADPLPAGRSLAAAGALTLLLAGCNLDLTGATCNTNENCPVRQYCSVPPGARQGTCQLGERITATLALGADPSLIPAGSSTQAVATLTAQGGPPVPDGGLVTDLVSWSVDPASESIISVGNLEGTRGLVEGLRPGQGLLVGTMSFAGQQLRATTSIVVSNAELQRVVVVPDRVQYAAGTAGNATAIGFFSDGSHADLTSLVKWTSSAPSVLAVSTASGSWGRLGALAPGMVLLQASYLDVTGSTSVTVSNATLTGLAISPLEPRGVQGIDLALEATGAFSDGSAQPMTRSVQWNVDDQSIGYFSSPGIVTLLSAGATTVRAVASNQQAAAELVVSPEAPVQLEISPALPDAIQMNGTARLSAWLTHQDGTVVPTAPSWSSVDRTVDVSPIGEVTAVTQPGVGTVIASQGGLEARASIEATVDAIEGWHVWPPELVVPVGAEGSLVFERILSGGIVQDLTQVAGWRPQSADAGIDVDTGERGGTVRTRDPGSRLSVVGIIPGAVARAWVRAPAGTPTLEIVPPSGTIPAGGRTRVAAVGHWPDGTVVDVTSATSWSASAGGVLTPGDGPSAGLVLGSTDGGVATLRARFGSATAQAQLEVEADAPLLEVWPPVATLAAGTALPVSVTLLTASGDATDVTADTVWRSNEPGVAIVTNAPDERGTLLAEEPGSAVLIGRVDGVQASFPVKVTEATLQEIALHPPEAIVTWAPSTFEASGTFSDGTVQDLTRLVTWTPQDPSLLRIRGTGPDRGIARGVDAGTVQVYAHPLGGEARTVSVTVTGAPPASLVLELPAGPVAVGTRPRVRAIARALDGTSVDVTEQAEWISSDPSLATVSSVVRPGSVRALRSGAPTLTARFAGLTAGAPLQISGTLIRLSVTAPGTLSVGASATATATATLSGGGTQVVADDVVWSSDDPGILGVSNAPARRGRLLAIDAGTTTLRARTRSGLPFLQASAEVTVSAPALRSPGPGTLRDTGTRR